MNGRDFNNIGQDLNRIIDQAIRMGSYGNLNRNINDTLKRAFQGGSTMGGNDWDFNLSKEQPKQAETWSEERWNMEEPNVKAYKPKKFEKQFFVIRRKRRTGPIAAMISGIVVGVVGICMMAMSMMGYLLDLLPFIDSAGNIVMAFETVFGIMTGAGAITALWGKKALAFSNKFDGYIKNLNGHEFIDIKRLAEFSHQPEKKVLKDIKKAMKKGWIPEGHLDHQEKCLMISDKSYEQYLNTLNNVKKQEEERKLKAEAATQKSSLTPETKAFIDKGHEYVRAIRKSNDEIPGEEMSNKMYHMELLVKKIFENAEAHPENIPDLKKMINYYLPMTMKLFKAYEEFDKQPVQGENIINSKKEIENTIDTLNIAYEKLLDDLFRDTAWDVSSDISVLETMLAKEGLTGNDFKMK